MLWFVFFERKACHFIELKSAGRTIVQLMTVYFRSRSSQAFQVRIRFFVKNIRVVSKTKILSLDGAFVALARRNGDFEESGRWT
jgi:hypothetical protein